jgi:hypothetical protein
LEAIARLSRAPPSAHEDRRRGRDPEVARRALPILGQLIGDAEPDVQKALSWAYRSLAPVDLAATTAALRAETDRAVAANDGHRAWVIRLRDGETNLLAGLIPYLDRDEPEVAIWMFFNAFAACYRDQIGAMVEHPFPQLGFSNAAHFKTSDQSNALSWLRHLVVHVVDDTLHVGRAVPRAWLADGQRVSATGVHTPFGAVSVSYTSELSTKQIWAVVEFAFHESPRRCVLRFRHPSKTPLRAVEIDGKPHPHFEPLSGDVDLTGMNGRLAIRASY